MRFAVRLKNFSVGLAFISSISVAAASAQSLLGVNAQLDHNLDSKTAAAGQVVTAKLDGTPAPHKGSDEFNGVSLKLIDDRTIEESDLNDGKVVKISRWSLSPDGQTMHARFDDLHGHIQEQDGHKVK